MNDDEPDPTPSPNSSTGSCTNHQPHAQNNDAKKRKLATTQCVDWELRISLAREMLAERPPVEATAIAASALLIGCLQSDLPPTRYKRCE